ncbi:NACHT domain-containing protein [Aspergillus alliaceus]|uniref:NACHT domain-containing protein n=1 Tax=Petromyces alliaceus TaxID=209559 RepID=A0A5N7C2J0_PETAA|nr:NACHT domain-containing protein [Aspergillus alliaceus]
MLNGTFFRSPPTETKQVVERLNNAGKADKETEALRALVKRMVELFRDEQRPSYFGEAAMLAKVASGNEYQTLIFAFSRAITAGTADGSPVDLDLLKFFACSLRQSKDRIPRETATRLGAVLGGLSKHMSNAQNFADLETQYFLLCTINVVLDAMVDINFSGIDRETLYTPLTEKLRDLSNDPEPRMAQAARYAFQALSRVPDNEGPWQAFFRTSGTAINAITKISSGAATMDPKKFVDAAPDIIELCMFFKKVVETSRDILSASDDIRSLITGMQDAAAQHGWYDALRQTDVLITSGAYGILKSLILGLPCQQEKSFWCGLYAQLEQCWVDDKPSKHGAVDFIEWTFGQLPLKKLSSKHRSVQEWIRSLSYTFHQPSWGKQLSKPKRKLSLRFFSDKEQEPALKSRFQYRQPNYDQGFPLLQAAMRGCKEAQLFYADVTLSQHYTREGRLDIERLSGERAPIDTCYINLALIERKAEETRNSQASEFSLFERLKVGGKAETDVPLGDLFKPRRLSDGTTRRPSRILIRGRAGVGKTTLCKKIIHDYLSHRLWETNFDRAFWIPLRKLKDQDSLEQFLKKSYFENTFQKTLLFPTLWDTICDENHNRTLFILDGLDEIIGYQRPEGSLMESFERLLNRSNVIITSRPYAVYPSHLKRYDLEVETTGFRDHQIESYLKEVVKNEPKIDQIKLFIAQHWLIKGLIRIPIQLDALCFTWDEELSSERTLSTMTDLYGAIEKKLWHKDMVGLEKAAEGRLLTGHTARKYKTRRQIEKLLAQEIALLELIAFTGIYHNITEFKWDTRSKVYDRIEGTTDDTLDKISFLRSSDPSLNSANQNYYFIHLTFQEYFAAQYFVRCWRLGKPLQCLELEPNESAAVQPEELINEEKYNGRFDIMWRFVSGLLEAEGEKHLVRFLTQIESEPRDLLGPVHFRLLMHCFSEVTVSSNNPTLQNMRTMMESHLTKLLLFEGQMGRKPSQSALQNCVVDPMFLGTEMEFSEKMLARILDEGGYIHRQIALEALIKRPQVSPSLLTRVLSFLEPLYPLELRRVAARITGSYPEFSVQTTVNVLNDPSPRVFTAILSSLRKQQGLPEDILQAVIPRFETRDYGRSAQETIESQLSLPDSIIKDLSYRLNDGNPFIRARAFKILSTRLPLQESMLKVALSLLGEPNDDVKLITLSAFEKQPSLVGLILDAVIAKLEDTAHYRSVQMAAKILEEQETLPKYVIEDMWSKIGHEDSKVRNMAFNILQKQLAPSLATWMEVFDRSSSKDIVASAVTKGLFEHNLTPPEKILKHCVLVLSGGAPHYIKKSAVLALQGNQSLPVDILDKLSLPLMDRAPWVRHSTLRVFCNQSSLSHTHIKLLASRLKPERRSSNTAFILEALHSEPSLPHDTLRYAMRLLTGEAAVSTLCNQRALPPKILQSLISVLRARDIKLRANAERVLRKHVNLGDLLPGLGVECWVSLLKVLLEKSFYEGIVCFIENNYLYISIPGSSSSERCRKIDIGHPEQQQKLRTALETIKDDLDRAVEVTQKTLVVDNDDIITSIAELL